MGDEASEQAADYRKLCSHYSRGCSFVSPCCGKVYPCRLCHDDQELTHQIDRHKVTEVECRNCHKRQPVAGSCSDCGISFGRYFCSVCRLYADQDKQQFHCDKCGLCRAGGRENFFHCETCGYCLSVTVKDSHFCRSQASRDNCPVCMEDLHTSRSAMHTTECGHLLHADCYKQMLQKGLYQCPQCQRSITDMSNAWLLHDEEREAWQMPQHLRDFKVKVKCRDCAQETETLFHVVGFKCGSCGSYNTVRCGNEEIPEDEGEGAEVRPGHILQEMLRMIREMRQRFRGRARGGEGEEEDEESGDEDEEEEEEEEEGEDEFTSEESEAESGDEAIPSDNEVAEETAEPLHDVSDSQTGYEADGSGTDEEPPATTSLPTPSLATGSGQATAGPHVEPESDQATGSWYGVEDSSSEQEWSMTLPTALSDWTNSFTQSDGSWETEEEEVIIGGDPEESSANEPQQAHEEEEEEENWESEEGDGETMATAIFPMVTFLAVQPSANAYDAHIRLDQNGAAGLNPSLPPFTTDPTNRD